MIKLFISDVDGTLLQPGESEISESVKRYLRTLLASGKSVAIASGRTYKSLTKLFGELAETVYLIPCDGALCLKNGRVLYHRPISVENVRRAISVAKENGLCLHLAAADHGYAFGGAEFEAKLTKEHTEDFIRANSLSDVKAQIYKIAFYGRAPNFPVIPADLRRSYRSDGWCEYVYRYADKGTALSDLQNRLYLSKLDTAALGDGANDEKMLKGAKRAFALSDTLAEASGAQRIVSAEKALELIIAE